MTYMDGNPGKTPDQLLADVREAAHLEMSASRSGFTALPVATLLVRLSHDAGKRAKKSEELANSIERLTKRLLLVTYFLLFLTLGLFAKEALELYRNHEKPNQSHTQPQQKQ